MVSELLAVVVDCRDAPALARFRATALGRRPPLTWDDGAGRTYVEVPGERA